MMKLKIILTIMFTFTTMMIAQVEEKFIYVASWNLENLFDNIDDIDKDDEEWLSNGIKEWSNEKINQKLKNLSKIIRYMNDIEGPDILGVQEVEHEHLLTSLIDKHFCDKNYKISYVETLDKRGIDNGLIYDADKFELVEKLHYEVKLESGYQTRYIFQTTLKHNESGALLYTFVNHWPSRRGGEEESRPNRVKAAETLKSAIQKIHRNVDNPNIIVLGDFNDEPDNESIYETLQADKYICESSNTFEDDRLYNLAYSEFKKGWGTYLYRGDWNMLDQIIVSKNLVVNSDINYVCNSFEIIRPQIMVTTSGPYKGASRPTFGGRIYLGGFSDHFPVGAKFIIN